MVYLQRFCTVTAKKRGFHLITDVILSSIQKDLSNIKVGLCNLFIQHSSAGLTSHIKFIQI
jgi:thiamine phosphate synthase YjbQ (UPF0047 family)